jgi:Ca2+/Na+ antiporter
MKKWLKSPWCISIYTALFSFLLTVIYDLIKGKQILSTIGLIFVTMWNWILTILNFKLKVWWIISGILLMLFVLYFIFKLSELREEAKPEFTNYREDHFTHWKWVWDWEKKSYENTWHVVNLTAHCPKCDTPMIDFTKFSGTTYKCPRCSYITSDYECDYAYEIEQVIIDNVNRNAKKQGYKK